MRLMQYVPSIGLVLACVSASPVARAAWDFVPTPLEWQTWPLFCRVQYSWVNAGFEFEYGGTFPASEIDEWRNAIGDRTFTGLHHWCASMHFLNRSRVQSEPRMKKFLLNRAWEDAMFSFTRTDPQSTVYPQMVVTVSQILIEMGKPEEAQDILNKGIAAQPQRPEPYVMLALLHRKQHKLDLARDALKQADSATGGASAEIAYDLGLIDLELGDVDTAVVHAKRAYGQGYPLQGLKQKLQRIGRWDDNSQISLH